MGINVGILYALYIQEPDLFKIGQTDKEQSACNRELPKPLHRWRPAELLEEDES